jgi:hypothetical protein
VLERFLWRKTIRRQPCNFPILGTHTKEKQLWFAVFGEIFANRLPEAASLPLENCHTRMSHSPLGLFIRSRFFR